MIANIEKYKIISKISTGGMANIYLALDTKKDKKVALKILKEELIDKEHILDRFTREGLLRLEHNNIVKVLELSLKSKKPFIVMEYIEGIDLGTLIKNRGYLTIDEILFILKQLLGALKYIHKLGIIHRDIKPNNVIISKDFIIKLTDFGIAKTDNKNYTSSYIGAPVYSSPEQLNGDPVDLRSDIYSLGITIYECLTGKTPFNFSSMETIIKQKFLDKPTPIFEHRKGIPAYLIGIVDKCIKLNPNDRYSDINEIYFDLLNKKTDSYIIYCRNCSNILITATNFCQYCGKDNRIICECGQKISTEHNFCPYCQKDYRYKCSCGNRVAKEFRYCLNCGKKIIL